MTVLRQATEPGGLGYPQGRQRSPQEHGVACVWLCGGTGRGHIVKEFCEHEIHNGVVSELARGISSAVEFFDCWNMSTVSILHPGVKKHDSTIPGLP